MYVGADCLGSGQTWIHLIPIYTEWCEGLGVCQARGILVKDSSALSSTDDSDLVTDNAIATNIGIDNVGRILLFVKNGDNSLEMQQKLFYGDEISFLSHDYVIDNSSLLQELGLSEPLNVQAGIYDVYEAGDMQYIIIGQL